MDKLMAHKMYSKLPQNPRKNPSKIFGMRQINQRIVARKAVMPFVNKGTSSAATMALEMKDELS